MDDNSPPGRQHEPGLFSPLRLPATGRWRPLYLGFLGVALTALPLAIFRTDRARWLVLGALWAGMGLFRLTTTRQARVLGRQIRLSLPSDRSRDICKLLLWRWKALDILSSQVASAVEIRRFEQAYGVTLPGDIRDYFLYVNGTSVGECGSDDELELGFWHLDQVRTFAETRLDDVADATMTFAFADHCWRSAVYGVRLSPDPTAATPVVAVFPHATFTVAPTFADFLARYLVGDASALFPAFIMIADDIGIGAESEGTTTYTIQWADVRQIAVQVVVWDHGAAAAALAFWVVRDQSDRIVCTAPVDTVAGGHLLRARIRALDGFDEQAFESARRAEAAHETVTLVVWAADDRVP